MGQLNLEAEIQGIPERNEHIYNKLVLYSKLQMMAGRVAMVREKYPENNFFKPAKCGEQDIVVTASFRCMCVHCECVPCASVCLLTCKFVHGFQNNLAQLFSLRSKSAI